MMIENEINTDSPFSETDLTELRDHLEPILKMASDISDGTTSLVYIHDGSDIKILESYGDFNKPMISAARKISGIMDPENGLSIIQNIREHQQAASLLSDLEIDKIQFYAGALFRNKTGIIGAFCVCDSKPHELTEVQKQQLRVMAEGVKTQLMFGKQKEMLNESSRKLKISAALIKNSADLTFLLEPELGKIIDVSNRVEKELGYSPDLLRGKPFTDIVMEDELDGETIDQWFLTENHNKGRYSTTVHFIDYQNRKKTYKCDFSADKNHWYVTARDISDKKEAEHGVDELKEKLQKIVSVATDLIYELDWKSGDLSWGDELTDVLGYPHTEKFVDYDWWLDKIHPDDLERVIQDVAHTVEGQSQKVKLVYRIRAFDESYKYVMNRVYVDRNEDGTPETIIGAIVDISELVKIKEESYRNKQLLEELADNAWSATWVRDENGMFLFANDKFKSLLGLTGKKVVTKSVYDLFDDDIASQFKANDQKALESGEPVVFEEKLKLNGNVRCYKTNIFPIKGVAGLDNIVGGVSVDITEEKESQELVQRSLEEKNILLAEIHHRVKNNLAVVSGILHLQAFNETDENIQQKLYSSTGRIQTMATIHELLYKSSSFKNLRLDKNVEQLITNICNTYNQSINLDVSYDMEPVELNINDAIPCSLIVNEVVTNVLKHAYNSGDSGLLNVSLIQEGKTVTLKIRDDGKGLPDDFDKTGNGKSLGMELIQTLTKQLKGTYSYSSLDRGAEFKLVFNKSDRKGVGSNLK
ncbi:PAS domain S-box protein [Rhodohalobacter sp. SW132]|uniref:PAS domain S-box protein n=1 Tax=Rhodohalobacter sp. SW132 TaxID=2293433 RepID=UPI000E24FEC6|nr:PAS domain S-box protein [Rhodohalobacter sp. SW132]REL33089.1 PAS domain S-box protein [Rhodohalobacter sp. SW132]